MRSRELQVLQEIFVRLVFSHVQLVPAGFVRFFVILKYFSTKSEQKLKEELGKKDQNTLNDFSCSIIFFFNEVELRFPPDGPVFRIKTE